MSVPATPSLFARLRSFAAVFSKQPEPITIGAAYQHFTDFCKREYPDAQHYLTFDGLHVFFHTEPIGIEVSVRVRITSTLDGKRFGSVSLNATGTVYGGAQLLHADAVLCDALDFTRYCERSMRSWEWIKS